MANIRETRKDQIYNLLVTGAGEGMTAREIGDTIGLKKTPYLIALLNELEHEGYVQIFEGTTPNGLPVFLYYSTVREGE